MIPDWYPNSCNNFSATGWCVPHRWNGKTFVLRIMLPFSKDKFNFLNTLFLEQFQVHSKIKQKVQKLLMYPPVPTYAEQALLGYKWKQAKQNVKLWWNLVGTHEVRRQKFWAIYRLWFHLDGGQVTLFLQTLVSYVQRGIVTRHSLLWWCRKQAPIKVSSLWRVFSFNECLYNRPIPFVASFLEKEQVGEINLDECWRIETSHQF